MDIIVCGIDPGLAVTGYAVLRTDHEPPQILDAGDCRFDRNLSMARRLVDIDRDISEILEEHAPDIVAVEQLYAHYAHPRTAILMAHARGVIICAAARKGIDVRDYGATQVKRFLCGNGRATKSQVQRSIKAALQLEDPPASEDMADALAIALCCVADLRKCRVSEVHT